MQDFGFVGAAETLSRAFALRNAGDTAVSFCWSAAPPFSLDPPQGTLPPGATATITATFAPTRAGVYDVEARRGAAARARAPRAQRTALCAQRQP